MTRHDRTDPGAPFWTETLVAPGRGNVGTGMFDRVFYVDVFDGPQGQVRVRTLGPGAGGGLSQVISTGHEVALEDDRSAMLLLPQNGRIFCAAGRRDLVARPGQAMVLPRGRRRTVTTRDGDRLFRALALRLADPDPRSPLVNGATLDLARLPDLAAAARLLAGIVQPGPKAGLGPDPLRETARDPVPDPVPGAMMPGPMPGAAVLARLAAAADLAAAALASLAPGPDLPHPTPAAERALRRAEALMRVHVAEEITIRDMAERAGLSMRQLQHLFATAHGMSPHAWLTRLRLEQAHLQLKGARPMPSVTEAALSSGFSHLGRFPGRYRARFGALPSVTRDALP